MTFLQSALTAIALTSGNFIYQLSNTVPNWHEAMERSWFQAMALFVAWICWRDKVSNDQIKAGGTLPDQET